MENTSNKLSFSIDKEMPDYVNDAVNILLNNGGKIKIDGDRRHIQLFNIDKNSENYKIIVNYLNKE